MERPPAPAAPLGTGSIIAGKYRLMALVAEGGMGAVWRAEDLQLTAPVAVKLLHTRHARDVEMRARFEAEAAIAAQLRSPHVVQVFERGVDVATHLPFITMELLEGENLQERLARRGPLAPQELLRVVSQVARALTRAHALGIIHRDLKPANIFLVRDGETELAKVLDFGIAKRFADSAGRAHTVTGDLLGTPTYMSPEQITGSRAVDHRSDLWSLAVIAVECLTGKLPFDSQHLAGLALAISHGRSLLPSSLGPVPPGFDAWFERATSLRVEARFNSATELVQALRSVCGAAPAQGGGVATIRGGAAANPVSAGATLPPATQWTRLRTLQLLRPEQLLRLRTRRWLLWASLGGGTLLILVALLVRLPAASSLSDTLPPSPNPPDGAPRVLEAQAVTAEAAEAPSVEAPVIQTERSSLRPASTASPAALASEAAPTSPPGVEPAPLERAAAPPRAQPPRSATRAPRAEPGSKESPEARQPPAADPDNLGF